MKIRLAIVEKDTNYLSRIVSAFNIKYAEQIETYSFTNLETAMQTLDEARIDVLAASDRFEIDPSVLPRRCGFAYLVESPDIESLRGQKVICKFQRVDLIYKQVLNIYSENAESISGVKLGGDGCKIVVFSSPCGGVGTSTMAAACAVSFAAKRGKTLYLNLERFGAADVFFSGEGQFDLSDVIYAVKAKRASLPLKLESCVRQDATGVCFYSRPKLALDRMELTSEDLSQLVSELQTLGDYEYIIVDMDFTMDKAQLAFFRRAAAVVLVSDGSVNANDKLFSAYRALAALEQGADVPLTGQLLLAYNKFSSRNGRILQGVELKNIGGAQRFENATPQQLLQQLAAMGIFDKILA